MTSRKVITQPRTRAPASWRARRRALRQPFSMAKGHLLLCSARQYHHLQLDRNPVRPPSAR